MRNLILGIVFLLSLQLSAQELSLWNLKYGMTQKQVISQLEKERGLSAPDIIDDTDSDEISIYYRDCSFAGEDAEFVELSFYKDQFYLGMVMLEPKESRLLSTYDSFIDDLSSKYGEPDKNVYDFDYPFQKGDGYDLIAIRNGKSNITCTWDIPKKMPTSKIGIIITDEAKIVIVYSYSEISNIVIAKEKRKNLEDL